MGWGSARDRAVFDAAGRPAGRGDLDDHPPPAGLAEPWRFQQPGLDAGVVPAVGQRPPAPVAEGRLRRTGRPGEWAAPDLPDRLCRSGRGPEGDRSMIRLPAVCRRPGRGRRVIVTPLTLGSHASEGRTSSGPADVLPSAVLPGPAGPPPTTARPVAAPPARPAPRSSRSLRPSPQRPGQPVIRTWTAWT